MKFITLTNFGYLQYSLNALHTAREQGIEDITVYCIGQNTFDRVKSFGYDAVLVDGTIDHKVKFRDSGWTDIVFKKFEVILRTLKETNKPVLFFDGDIVFLRKDIVSEIKSYDTGGLDFIAQQDGSPSYDRMCSGFMYIFPTERIYKFLSDSEQYTKFKGDQEYLNFNLSKFKHKLLDWERFPNGWSFIQNRKDLKHKLPFMMHYNFCIGEEKYQLMEKNKHVNYTYRTQLVNKYGIMELCDRYPALYSHDTRIVDVDDYMNIQEGDVIYVVRSALGNWINTVLPSIKNKFVLVTGDSVVGLYEEENTQPLLDSPYLIRWFSCNVDRYSFHEKVQPIPLGLTYHDNKEIAPLKQENDLLEVYNASKPFYKRKLRTFSYFQFRKFERFDRDRYKAIEFLAKCPLNDFIRRKLPLKETCRLMSEYQFVISPHGNGLDCHRTYEALAMGCIPIMRKSPLENLFSGLPVLFVEEWSDITQDLLEKTSMKYRDQMNPYSMEKLQLKYWTDMIFGEKNRRKSLKCVLPILSQNSIVKKWQLGCQPSDVETDRQKYKTIVNISDKDYRRLSKNITGLNPDIAYCLVPEPKNTDKIIEAYLETYNIRNSAVCIFTGRIIDQDRILKTLQILDGKKLVIITNNNDLMIDHNRIDFIRNESLEFIFKVAVMSKIHVIAERTSLSIECAIKAMAETTFLFFPLSYPFCGMVARLYEKPPLVDRIYYLNLERRPDRRIFMERQLQKYRLSAQRVSAVDGNTLQMTTQTIRTWNKYALGALITHRLIIEDAHRQNYDSILVMEDDAELKEDWREILERAYKDLPSDWHMLYLSGGHNKPPEKVTDNIYKLKNTYGAFAIIMNKRCYENILKLTELKIAPIDVIYSRYHERFPCYIVNPGIARNIPSYSDILRIGIDYNKKMDYFTDLNLANSK